jgi:hypothetical protein
MAGYAEKIGKKEKANLPVVLCAAYLYNIDEKNTAQKPLEKDKSGTIQAIMEKLGVREELIQEIIHITDSDSSPKEGSLERQILHDADILALMDAYNKENHTEKDLSCTNLERQLLTSTGKELLKGKKP